MHTHTTLSHGSGLRVKAKVLTTAHKAGLVALTSCYPLAGPLCSTSWMGLRPAALPCPRAFAPPGPSPGQLLLPQKLTLFLQVSTQTSSSPQGLPCPPRNNSYQSPVLGTCLCRQATELGGLGALNRLLSALASLSMQWGLLHGAHLLGAS